MRLVQRKPGVGYLDTWLWLPKSHVSERQLRSTLTFIGRDEREIEAWKEEEHHYRVPRNFIRPEVLGNLPYQIYDTRFKDFPRVSFRSSVTLDFKEPDKDYQTQGSQALLSTQDGILSLRCGAGKTVVALHTAAQLNTPILILVDDTGLAAQWISEITAFLDVTEDEVGRVWGGKFDWKRRITVATVQTIASHVSAGTLPHEMVQYFGVLLLDEAHVMGAPYFNTAVPPFHGRRWGLSATPSRDDEFDSLLEYTVGPVVYSYLMPELKPTVFFRALKTPINLSDPAVRKEMYAKNNMFHYTMAYGYLATLDARTEKIVKDIKDAVASGRQVLVLSHSRAMVETLGTHFPEGGVTHGGVKADEHWEVVKTKNPVIAIMKRGKQALNKPSLDAIFVCDPFSKPGVLQQTMGRALRGMNGKKDPIIVFFEDVHLKPLVQLCRKLRKTLARWPAHKGGSIPFERV